MVGIDPLNPQKLVTKPVMVMMFLHRASARSRGIGELQVYLAAGQAFQIGGPE
jgi:hypothetical protein